MKEKATDKLREVLSALAKAKKEAKSLGNSRPQKDFKSGIEALSLIWFETLEPILSRNLGLNQEPLTSSRSYFDQLLKMISSQASGNAYCSQIDSLLPILREIEIEVKKFSGIPNSITRLNNYLDRFTDGPDKEYFLESVKCANAGMVRASVVMAWCATISCLHRFVENQGFAEFNKKSTLMKGITTGRYKRFNKEFSITTKAEMQSVFDSDLLWVLEFWNLIDSNEHERLSICFTIRNNCAHPGNAPLTEDNLLSFFSDICEIVHFNNKFSTS